MAERTPPPARNLALDNLRVVAMLLGLVTHGVLPFKATEIGRYPIHDCQTHLAADLVYFAVHDFRMELFFVLAGFAAAGLATRKGVAELVRNRAKRIALPLLLGVITVAPLMHLLFTYRVADQDTGPEAVGWADVAGRLRSDLGAGPNFHLWFLYYLLLFYVPLVLATAIGPRLAPGRAVRAADAAFGWFLARWWKPALLALACVPVLWTMRDWWIETPQGWWPRPTIYLYYLGFFLFGAMLNRHADWLAGYGRRWPVLLTAANMLVLPAMLALTMTGNRAEEAAGPDSPAWLVGWKATAIFLGGLYTWLMIEGLVGLFHRFFSGSRVWWKYLAESSYWCYLAGFPVQVALQVALADHPMPILAKFVLVNLLTFGVLLASYELMVRHTWVGLLLNGKVPERKAAGPVAVEPVVLATRVRVAEPARRPVRTRDAFVGPPAPVSARAPVEGG